MGCSQKKQEKKGILIQLKQMDTMENRKYNRMKQEIRDEHKQKMNRSWKWLKSASSSKNKVVIEDIDKNMKRILKDEGSGRDN